MSDRPLRVVLQQPTLAKYRLAVFQDLASRPNIDLLVLYGDNPGIKNVEPVGFEGRLVPLSAWSIAGQAIIWHRAQWQAAGDQQTDVLILSWGIRYLSLIPALLRARWRGIPTVLWGHGYAKTTSRLVKAARRWVAGLSTALLFYEHTTAQAALADGEAAGRVFVAPNCIDQRPIDAARAKWLDDPQKLERFRAEQQLEGKRVLLFVSRLVPENRLDMLLRAVKSLSARVPNLVAILIGGGPEEQARLEALAAELQVQDRVRLLGPIFDEDQLAPWFLSAELFVYPANIGLSLLHAFGYGLPVITNDERTAHGPEIAALEDGVNGLLYARDDQQALERAIVELLEDEPRRERMAQAARATVQHRYSVPHMVDGFVAAIEYCAHQGARRN